MTTRYVHTLLFSCPSCKLPMAVVRLSTDESLEPVDGERQKFICLFCEKSANIIAAKAKMHLVDKWRSRTCHSNRIVGATRPSMSK